MQKVRCKVLFFVSPVTEMAWPWQKLGWMIGFVPQIQSALDKAGYSVESTCVVSADLEKAMSLNDVEVEGRIVALSQNELLDGFRFNAFEETARYQGTGESSDYFNHLGELLYDRLGHDYQPDLVISFAPSPFFAALYPKAVVLYHELGVFSRRPYPETYYFDPHGATRRNFVSVFAGEINAAAPEENGFVEALEEFRRGIAKALRANEAIDGYFRDLRKKHRKLLLVPLGYEHFADACANFPYQTQLEFVEHIIDTVDCDTGVLLTQHPSHRALADDTIAALKASHANLLNELFYSRIENFSQVAMAYCDTCITQSSTLAYQAAFLGKYLVTVGGFCAGIADGHSVEDLPRIYGKPPMRRDNFFVWTIRHHITDAENMPEHLRRLIEAWRDAQPANLAVASWPKGLSLDEFRSRLHAWRGFMQAPVGSSQGRCTFYFDQGSNFSEENSLRTICLNSGGMDELGVEVHLPQGCKRLRFDPVEGHAVICEELSFSANGDSLPVIAVNGVRAAEGWVSLSNDPQFICEIPEGVDSIKVRAKFTILPEAEALQRCEQECKKLQDAANVNRELLAESRIREASYSSELAKLHSEHERFAQEHDRLTAELSACRAEHEQLVAAHERFSVSYERLVSEHVRLVVGIDRLEAELAKCRSVSAEWECKFYGISNSTCWRITKPLRFILDKLKACLSPN